MIRTPVREHVGGVGRRAGEPGRIDQERHAGSTARPTRPAAASRPARSPQSVPDRTGMSASVGDTPSQSHRPDEGVSPRRRGAVAPRRRQDRQAARDGRRARHHRDRPRASSIAGRPAAHAPTSISGRPVRISSSDGISRPASLVATSSNRVSRVRSKQRQRVLLPLLGDAGGDRHRDRQTAA